MDIDTVLHSWNDFLFFSFFFERTVPGVFEGAGWIFDGGDGLEWIQASGELVFLRLLGGMRVSNGLS